MTEQERVRAVTTAYDDLDWLAANGALTGVAEIMRERRRQIEQLGRTPDHDREHHSGGGLMWMTEQHVWTLLTRLHDGLAGPAEAETELVQTAALAAAEVDRLAGEFG